MERAAETAHYLTLGDRNLSGASRRTVLALWPPENRHIVAFEPVDEKEELIEFYSV